MTERLPMVHRRFRIDPRIYAAAIATARRRGEYLSQIIRDAVAKYVTDNQDTT